MKAHKKRVKHVVKLKHETNCDFCGKAISEANQGLALVTNFVIRVDDKETPSTKPHVIGETLGWACLGCMQRVDAVLRATKRQPNRVTLGLENESMISRAGVIIPFPGNQPISHAEIQNHNGGLAVTYFDKASGNARRFHVNTKTGLRAEVPL